MDDFNFYDYDWFCDNCGEELEVVDTNNWTSICPCCGTINSITIEDVIS